MNLSLPQIRHNQPGFEALVRLWAQTNACFLENIDIDLSATSWFDADMCAPFGAILHRLGQSLNDVTLHNMHRNVATILSKNGFLSHYGRATIPDVWGTTIPYQRFDTKDDRYFASYIETEFMRRVEMPVMSPGLLKKFRESVFEIFSNAVLPFSATLSHPFPGTVVSIEINTADTQSYVLASELSEADIF